MSINCIEGQTIDDLMRDAVVAILEKGEKNVGSRGSYRELRGVFLELINPRARLSRTETRGKPFSCLGELCWYLAGSNDLAFIHHYLPKYDLEADGEKICGGYGPRLFNWKGINQIENVKKMLLKKPSTRNAVIQLFDASDLASQHKSPPCTCTLQFMGREGKLELIVHMRSNDAFIGMPHDIFCFTMIQEIMARMVGLDVGPYKHVVGNFHLYQEKESEARAFVDEGYQSTLSPMPDMPFGDPWPAIDIVLTAESQIRANLDVDQEGLSKLDPYWSDLIRLLQAFRMSREKNIGGMQQILSEITSKNYEIYLQKRIGELRGSPR